MGCGLLFYLVNVYVDLFGYGLVILIGDFDGDNCLSGKFFRDCYLSGFHLHLGIIR